MDLRDMKDRKKRSLFSPWRAFFFPFLFVGFFLGFTFFTLCFSFGEVFRPKLLFRWRFAAVDVKAVEVEPLVPTAAVSIQETVVFPDQVLLFLNYPPSASFFTKVDLSCVYSSPNSSEPHLDLAPESTNDEYSGHQQIVRCPLPLPGLVLASLAVKPIRQVLPAKLTYRWDSLAYEAVIDRDNTTVVFVKGLNLRSGKAAEPFKFKCLYGWNFSKPKYVLRSDVVSIAQEVVRCKTPAIVLKNPLLRDGNNSSIKVTVKRNGRWAPMKSVARPRQRLMPSSPTARKQHELCVCTMLRNQARFLREWVIYHTRIGVERWLIYDNNSSDDIEDVVESLVDKDYRISRHVWPWIKTQEAGFAHCALRAKHECEWVGFIDVDEFLHLPNTSSGLTLKDVIRNASRSASTKEVGELRISCLNFGPSGLNRTPAEGVTIGYTCRMIFAERQKSIVRPEAVNDSLINVVHHFELKDGFRHVNVGRHTLIINHYKYQVWEVFKEKFYRRVSAYVSDWQREEHVGSKDRTPGLGTKAVEPPHWASKFCEVNDTGLRDRVIGEFTDPVTRMLPWQQPWKAKRSK